MDIIAHRGASTYRPENTLAAFQKALELGVNAIELDVRLSKDDIPVVCHDSTINRTSNGKGYVHRMPLHKLKKYDFGSHFNKKYKKEKIPTLEEVLQLVGSHSVLLHIELKNGPNIPENFESNVLEVIYRYNFQKRVVYSSFDHLSLERLSTIDPQAKIGLLFHINLIHLFDYIDNTGLSVHSIHPNHFYVTKEIIEEAQQRHIEVNIYTVNNRKWALNYKRMGVNGLITNDPLIIK